MSWIQPAWSPLGWGSSHTTYRHTDAATHSTANTDTEVLTHRQTQTHQHWDIRRLSFLADPILPHTDRHILRVPITHW